MSRKLKKRAWWWTWSEWAAQSKAQREYLEALKKRTWGEGGRIEHVEFTDGSDEIRIPCKDGPSRMTNVITLEAPAVRK